jgi:hypothetical protein
MGSYRDGILKSISNEQKNPLTFDHPTDHSATVSLP